MRFDGANGRRLGMRDVSTVTVAAVASSDPCGGLAAANVVMMVSGGRGVAANHK